MQQKKFQRRIEDFACERCSTEVAGTGYTNHCPQCLWSKHVDVHPGDREEECCGLMEPVTVEKKGEGYVLLHRCVKCGVERKNKTSAQDDMAMLARVAGYGISN